MMYWTGEHWKTIGSGTDMVCTYFPKNIEEWLRLPFYNYSSRTAAVDRVKLATRTESPVNAEMIARFSNPKFIRLLHVGFGMATEAGEFLDQLKKHGFYGKELDEVNLMEELGDSDWYMNLCCDILNTTMQVIEEANIKKLAKRYGDKFSKDGALLRNLGAELMILEANLPKSNPVPPEHREHGNIQS